MSQHLILAIEVIAAFLALTYSLKKPITTPLIFLFLNILFSSQYVGRFNIPTLAFLLPSIAAFFLLNYKKLFFFRKNLKALLFFTLCAVAISCVHFLLWKQLPLNILRNSLLALCFAPFLLHEPQEKKVIEFINTGAFLFALATIILVPQAVKFYASTPDLSLGRKIAGGFALNHPSVKTWAVIPTVTEGDQILSSFFSLKEIAMYYYISLSATFFTYAFLNFFIKPLRLTVVLILSFALIYVSQYINLMLAFHMQLFMVTLFLLFYSRSKINYKYNLSTFILVLSINISFLGFTFTNPSLAERIVKTYYSTNDQNQSRHKFALSAKSMQDFYLTSTLHRVSSHEGRNTSRLARIKNSIKLLLKDYPLQGLGDSSRNNLEKVTKKGIYRFSNHSFITDIFVSLGLPLGIIFLSIPFLYLPIQLIKKSQARSLPILILGTLLISSLFNSSFLGTFGIQPFQLGFILYTVSLLCLNLHPRPLHKMIQT